MRLRRFILVLLGGLGLAARTTLGAVDHLIFTELVLQPSQGEYVIITNPTDQAIQLGNYYLTDATDPDNGKYYYNLPSGTAFWSESASDFLARFPDTSLAAGASIVIGLGRRSDFETEYGTSPDLALKEDFRSAVDGVNTIGASPYGKLDNTEETLILFYWDGIDSVVKDVDYLLWGGTRYAVDKSNVPGYQADTPVADQAFMPSHQDGEKLIRVGGEGTEPAQGGNGITGHDETGEPLDQTWTVVSLNIQRPTIQSTDFPTEVYDTDSFTISAVVTDETGLSAVELHYRFPFDTGDWQSETMTLVADSLYQVELGPLNATGTFGFYVKAINQNGLADSTVVYSITVTQAPEALTIRTIRQNLDQYLGQKVTLTAIVSIGSGIIRTDRTSMYIQDSSGYGINLNQSGLISPAMVRGDSVTVTGVVDRYVHSTNLDTTVQLTNFTYTILDSGHAVPAVSLVTTAELQTLALEGRFVQVSGVVTSRSDGVGGGSNVILEDAYGQITLRIWDTTHLLDDTKADSLLQPGNHLDVFGVAGSYRLEAQLLVAYPQDVQAHPEGVADTSGTSLTVAPYPFLPRKGEVIQYTFSFPANSWVRLRIFDLSGRYITTLREEYRALPLRITAVWDGRDETQQIVPPGVYLMQLETANRGTGIRKQALAPVVIGVEGR